MAKGQASISTIGKMADILREAHQTFDESENDAEAYKKALLDWYRNRQLNSKRASLDRIEKQNAFVVATVTQMDARLRAVEQNTKDILRYTTKLSK